MLNAYQYLETTDISRWAGPVNPVFVGFERAFAKTYDWIY